MMESISPADASLDGLARKARAGDAAAAELLFAGLRVRLRDVAKRRVQEDGLEDVIQDTLKIVHQKYRTSSSDAGILIWSFVVLRNVIGNYYQNKRRRQGRETPLEDLPRPPAGARLEEESDLGERLTEALATLARQAPRCGLIFRRILESWERGGGPREVSQRALATVQREEPAMTRGSFYTALHRCRARLRVLLDNLEARSTHE
jgi:hypothetical protein